MIEFKNTYPLAYAFIDRLVPPSILLADIPDILNPYMKRLGLEPINDTDQVEDTLAAIEEKLSDGWISDMFLAPKNEPLLLWSEDWIDDFNPSGVYDGYWDDNWNETPVEGESSGAWVIADWSIDLYSYVSSAASPTHWRRKRGPKNDK